MLSKLLSRTEKHRAQGMCADGRRARALRRVIGAAFLLFSVFLLSVFPAGASETGLTVEIGGEPFARIETRDVFENVLAKIAAELDDAAEKSEAENFGFSCLAEVTEETEETEETDGGAPLVSPDELYAMIVTGESDPAAAVARLEELLEAEAPFDEETMEYLRRKEDEIERLSFGVRKRRTYNEDVPGYLLSSPLLEIRAIVRENEREEIPYGQKIIEDSFRIVGYSCVDKPGKPGVRIKECVLTLDVSDGEVLDRRILSSRTACEPVRAKVRVGTLPQTDPGKVTGKPIWPVDGSEVTVSSYFHLYDPEEPKTPIHRGLDIVGEYGDSVFAVDGGKVTFSGLGEPESYGQFIEIDHGKGIGSRYAHLSEIFVSEGEEVARGQIIGKVGDSGNTTGAHLHFEVTEYGGYIDPIGYLPEDPHIFLYRFEEQYPEEETESESEDAEKTEVPPEETPEEPEDTEESEEPQETAPEPETEMTDQDKKEIIRQMIEKLWHIDSTTE